MVWANANPVTIGAPTRKSHYDDVFGNSQFARDSVGDFTSIKIGTGITGSAAAPIFSFRDDDNIGMYKAGTDILGLSVNSTLRLRIFEDGIVVGADTPKDWTSLMIAQLSAAGTLFGSTGTGGAVGLAAMAYFDGSWRYSATAKEAARAYIQDGQHVWEVAGTGTEDNVITWVEALRITNGGLIATGGETIPDVDVGGICLNQGAATDKILTFKSSTVAHGVTDLAETDTYGLFQLEHPTDGGLFQQGFSEATEAVKIQGLATTEDTSKNDASIGTITLMASLKNGTTQGPQDTTGPDIANLMVITNNGATTHIFDAEGDSHHSAGADWQTFDDYDDALAVIDCMQVLGYRNMRENLAKSLRYNAQTLHDMGVVRYTPASKSKSGKDQLFLSTKGILGLYGGAIGEIYKVMELALKKLGLDYNVLKEEVRGKAII